MVEGRETLNYSLEYWEFDFLVRHLRKHEDAEYDPERDEVYAEAERNGSTVIFHGSRDPEAAWLKVFSLNEDERLGKGYLEEMTEPRIESIAEESRETLGIR